MKIFIYLLAVSAAWAASCMVATAQVDISYPAEGTVSTLRNQAVTGQAPANLPIRIDINGVPADSGVVRADGVFEFLGLPTPEGPVRYTVVATMRGGRTFSAERSIHVIGAPDSIAVELPAEIPADGTSIIEVSGRVMDRWGVVIPGAYTVTVSADSLTIIASDADPASRGVQIPLESGAIRFSMKPSGNAGPAAITLEVNGLTVHRDIYLTTPRQPFMLTGSVSATGSYLQTTGPAGEFNGIFNATDGFNKQGRIAVTGRGTILDKYLLTLSVDSDRKLKDRLYRDLDPNVLYGLYGDNSTVTYEAQSASPVFLKIEQDQSYLMYGDFNTGLTQREFATYNRTFTGGKIHAQNSWGRADVFGTITNRKVVQEEIRGAGISGSYFLQNSNIVTGSEKVRIEVRDRLRNDVVISSQEKARFSDYDIDYTQGTLYFKQPVPSLDERENPVYIIISSEAVTTAVDNYVVGGSGEITLLDRLTLGATTVVEQRAPVNYMLAGGHGGLNLGDFGAVRGEVARSTDAEQEGYAWKVEGELTPFSKDVSIRPYYRRVDGSFNNTMLRGASQELGTIKYGASGDVQIFSGTRIAGDLYHQTQTSGLTRTDIEAISGSLRQTLWSGGHITAKVEDIHYNGNDPDSSQAPLATHSTFLNGRFDANIFDGLSGNIEGEYNVLRTAESVRPNSVGAGLEYEIIPAITLFAGQKFLDGGGMLANVGVRSKISDHTTMEGRYELGNALAGERSAASIGLKNVLKITDELTANILFEKTKNLSQNLVGARTPDHDALSLSLEYLPAIPLKVSVKGEYSGADNTTRTSVVYGVLYQAFDELSLLAKGNYYRDALKPEAKQNMQSSYVFGAAYRPTTADWLNVVGQVEMKTQDNDIVLPVARYRSTIVSVHAYAEPVTGIGLGVKYALKSAHDQTEGLGIRTMTDLVQARSQYDLTSFLNIAAEGRVLRQHELGDMKLGCSAEMGVVVLPNTMLVLGYNFQGYSERDLLDYTYTAKGPYVTIRAKFTESLFGLGD